MRDILFVGAGGALGAIGRYLVFITVVKLLGSGFPYATIIVNVSGSFVMGILAELIALQWAISLHTRLFLLVGCLGAFTTFSTFSLDVAALYQRKELGLAGLYIATSVLLSIGAFFVGLLLVRRVLVQ